MAAPMKRVVGWINKRERELVFQELYSNDPAEQRHALDKLAVWKCRVLNKLSTAIHCTWQLVAAQLQEHEARDQGTEQQQNEQLRMSYGIAVLRFINLLTEKGQTKAYARPVHAIAEELGVPEWIVDLRHDTAHANLPSLTLLKSAAQFALEWLRREYWEAQLSDDPVDSCQSADEMPQTKSRTTESDVEDVLLHYMDEKFNLISKEKEGSKTKEDGKAVKRVLSEMERVIIKYNKEQAVRVLVQDGYLCSTHQQLTSLGLQLQDLDTADLVLPPDYISFWRPVIKLFHSLRLTPLLLQTLLSELTDEDSLRNKMLAGWAATIVNAVDLADQDLYKQGHPYQLYGAPFELPEKLLLDMCARKSSQLSARLLTQLLSICSKIPAGKRKKLTKLCDIYTGTSLSGREHVSTNIRSLERLLRVCGQQQQRKKAGQDGLTSDVNNGWRLDDSDTDWSQVPIGSCPGLSLNATTLDLPETLNRLQADPSVDEGEVKLTENSFLETEDSAMETEDPEVIELSECTDSLWTSEHLHALQQDISIF